MILVTALYADGAVGTGILGAVVAGGLATAACAGAVFLWILEPREREALQQVAAGA